MVKLDHSRAESTESLLEVAVAMCAIDKMLEGDDTGDDDVEVSLEFFSRIYQGDAKPYHFFNRPSI